MTIIDPAQVLVTRDEDMVNDNEIYLLVGLCLTSSPPDIIIIGQ